ncbi:hypothetical protein [Kitasatospora sp. SUK 42]|uniref:hypothetical protein n=1 Tax=Kitasatospora sp. SUK 42 TaxID=1588882 RepID=UPI0018CA45CC|nr:hypothetical protein [Kitasatospora sp. SUK 42]MBV2155173.1 hypothetical protein [Kitasatospora sp. SUK 42]
MTGVPRRPRSRGFLRTATAVLIAGCTLLGAAACSDSPEPASGAHGAANGSPPPTTPQSGLAAGLKLPLSAYMETYDDNRAIERAVDKLTQDCMARFGFTYNAPERTANPASIWDNTNMARRYGLTDRSQVERYGYDLADEGWSPPPAPKMSPEELVVLTGRSEPRPDAPEVSTTAKGTAVPRGGCMGESLDKVGGQLDTSVPDRLDAESFDTAKADDRVQQAIQQWSGCMAEKGYQVALPADAFKLAPRVAGSGPAKEEIAVATADLDCKERTGLVKVWFDVESEVQRKQIEQNQLALTQTRERITAAVKSAVTASN